MGSTLYTQALSDKEKEKIYGESDLLIVPFCTDAVTFIPYLDIEGFKDDEDESTGKTFKDETDIFKLFDKLNEGKSPELRVVFVEETNYPLQLNIYKFKYN